MALIRPEIHQVLRNAGITRNGGGNLPNFTSNGDNGVSEKLNAAGLSIEECFSLMRDVIDSTEVDTVKINTIKMALEAHKVMSKDSSSAGPQINIIINDPQNAHLDVNPILLPRQLLPA